VVVGIDVFRAHFAEDDESFVLIGGVAAEMWLARAELPFRVTKDFDIVLLLDAINDAFLRKVWDFIRAGQYERKERGDGHRTYYRFSNPGIEGYPVMMEIFSRKPEGLAVPDDQTVVPIPAEEDASSLSAILMDDEYHRLVVESREVIDGLPYVSLPSLILLKASVWCDLTDRRAAGESIDKKHIKKHRNDVFRLALLLPTDQRMQIQERIHRDLTRLLVAFPPGDKSWESIEQSLDLGGLWPGSEVVISALREFFISRGR